LRALVGNSYEDYFEICWPGKNSDSGMNQIKNSKLVVKKEDISAEIELFVL